jgi:hypothetical protein
VTVGALHAQRRRDVLHRQLQLVEGDVFQDLKIFGGLRTTAAPAGPRRLLGPLRRSLWRLPGAQARAPGNGYEQDGRDQEPAEGLYDQKGLLCETGKGSRRIRLDWYLQLQAPRETGCKEPRQTRCKDSTGRSGLSILRDSRSASPLCAEVAELADAQASGACYRKVVEVQILSSANHYKLFIINNLQLANVALHSSAPHKQQQNKELLTLFFGV